MPNRPNILVFMTDQQHVLTTADGGPCRTPNLDRLAASGVRFTSAFTPSPICTPARSSFQTGLLPHQHRMTRNAHAGKHGYIVADFPEGTRVLGQAIRDCGYRTAYFGKWDSGIEHRPDWHGYEVYRAGRDLPAGPGSEHRPRGEVVIPGEPDPRRALISCATTGSAEDFAPFRVAAAVEELLSSVVDRGDGSPFYVFASCVEPHVPWVCPQPYADLYDPADIPEPGNYGDDFSPQSAWPASYLRDYNMQNYCHLPGDWPTLARAIAHYFGVVTMIDEALGRMLDSLARRGLLENTLVLFTSDHGEHMGRHGLVGKGCNLLEDTIRIPLIASWPAAFAAGECDRFVSLTDGFATVLDAAAAPDSPPPTSRSLLPLMRGEGGDGFPDRMFFEHHGTLFFDSVRGMRTRRYKYVFRPHETEELYDLQSDPLERHNRIADPALSAELAGLRRELLAWMEAQRDPVTVGVRLRMKREWLAC